MKRTLYNEDHRKRLRPSGIVGRRSPPDEPIEVVSIPATCDEAARTSSAIEDEHGGSQADDHRFQRGQRARNLPRSTLLLSGHPRDIVALTCGIWAHRG